MLQTLEKNEISRIVEQTKHINNAKNKEGKRRWAKNNMLPSAMGHKKGVEALKKTLKAAHKFGVKYLTLYAFSTENWNRKQEEVDFLMSLLANTIKSQLEELNQNNVKLRFIGYLKALNPSLQEILAQAEDKTKDNTGVNLQIAINYGARNEITNAIKEMMYQGIKPQEVDEELVSKFLYTSDIPDPDLLIRTGGEMRVSNDLLWQRAYCELYITKIYWPEFDEDALKNSILEFAKRQRRWGG